MCTGMFGWFALPLLRWEDLPIRPVAVSKEKEEVLGSSPGAKERNANELGYNSRASAFPTPCCWLALPYLRG